MFGLAVAGLTALLLAAALIRLAARRLPANRWNRATRFGVPGLGVGLTLTFTISALRIASPSPGVWLTLVVLGGVIGFVFGFLTPGPGEGDEDLDDADLYQAVDDADIEGPAGPPVGAQPTTVGGASPPPVSPRP